jgi:alpha-beta hydrolase superfamily lysophospholipase
MGPVTSGEPGGPEVRQDEGFFAAKDNLRLYWRTSRPGAAAAVKAHVALVHGYGDHSGRYRELMEHLARRGFAVHAFDYRGHGQSDGRRAYVERFSDYTDDLEVLLGHARSDAEGAPLFVVGHSLGGLIVLRWALEAPREGAAGLVLFSPFLQLAFQPPRVKVLAARVVERLLPWMPLGNELSEDQLTRDTRIQEATRADPLYLHTATPRWFFQTAAAQQDARARASRLSLPCLILHGDADPIAAPGASRELWSAAGSQDKTLKTYEGMRHELFNEIGREQVFSDLEAWLSARTPAVPPSA